MTTETEYGVRWEYASGLSFTLPKPSKTAALKTLEVGRGFDPKPVRVMRREVTSWEPINEGEQ